MLAVAQPDALFMHRLPAHRREEVTAEVIDGPRSVVWDEAANRLQGQKVCAERSVDRNACTSSRQRRSRRFEGMCHDPARTDVQGLTAVTSISTFARSSISTATYTALIAKV